MQDKTPIVKKLLLLLIVFDIHRSKLNDVVLVEWFLSKNSTSPIKENWLQEFLLEELLSLIKLTLSNEEIKGTLLRSHCHGFAETAFSELSKLMLPDADSIDYEFDIKPISFNRIDLNVVINKTIPESTVMATRVRLHYFNVFIPT